MPPRPCLCALAFTLTATVATLVPAVAQHVVTPLPPAPRPVAPARIPTALVLGRTHDALVAAPAGAAALAQFDYRDAIARYRRGDLTGARTAAIAAMTKLAEPGAPPPPQSLVKPLAPAPEAVAPEGLGARLSPFGAVPYGTALQIDADEFVARSRSAVASCVARKPDEADAAKRQFDTVWKAHADGNVVAERLAARALIERCGVLF